MWPQLTFGLRELLKLKMPILQAPLAVCGKPKLVASVSNNGALGSFGAGLMSPQQLRDAIREIKALTDKPFAVNLMLNDTSQKYSKDKFSRINEVLNAYRKELQLAPTTTIDNIYIPSYEEQLAIIIEEKVPIFHFTFGCPKAELIKQLKDKKIIVIGTATTCREAIELEQKGCDIIVAQGSEAGGHRGSFGEEGNFVGTVALVPQIVDKVKVPVVAAGGIMDGRGICAALALGAAGVQMGTAFLVTKEIELDPAWVELLKNSTDESTIATKAVTGKHARYLKNQLVDELEKHEENFLPYPIQLYATVDIRKAAVQKRNTQFTSYFAGQGSALTASIIGIPVKELLEKLEKETFAVIASLGKTTV